MPLIRAELLDRLKHHEDSFVERKTESDDFRPTLVAFANSVPAGREAVLFIGVRDDGQIDGVSNADSLQKKIQKTCSESCFPPIAFTTELLPVQEKIVIAVVIPPSLSRPHFAGQAFVREGNKSIKASERVFNDVVAARNTKAGQLQQYIGKPVTLISAKHQIGRPEFEGFQAGTAMRRALTERQAVITEVNSFFVRFEINQTRFAEPLDNLSLSYDEEKWRPLIVVRFDRP
jgi:hypothetical protein